MVSHDLELVPGLVVALITVSHVLSLVPSEPIAALTTVFPDQRLYFVLLEAVAPELLY